MSGEKGLLTQSMVALGVPTCYLGGTARGSEALRWRGWLPRMGFDKRKLRKNVELLLMAGGVPWGREEILVGGNDEKRKR